MQQGLQRIQQLQSSRLLREYSVVHVHACVVLLPSRLCHSRCICMHTCTAATNNLNHQCSCTSQDACLICAASELWCKHPASSSAALRASEMTVHSEHRISSGVHDQHAWSTLHNTNPLQFRATPCSTLLRHSAARLPRCKHDQ
jgi:hypothetical protein